jgi:2-phospho-L-lactate guanylyltransferase
VSVAILVPVKNPNRAKIRMAPILSGKERSRLAGAMLDDLIRSLKPLGRRVVLVTDSEPAAKIARSLGWRVLWESNPISESASVDEASRQLARENTSAVLRLPADIPLAETEDIRRLLDFGLTARAALLVPSRDGLGTNAVLRKPPDLFPSRFGHNSFVLHTQEGLRAGAEIHVLENSRIALDLDDPGDILKFLAHGSDTSTGKLLADLKIGERLGQVDGRPYLHLGP